MRIVTHAGSGRGATALLLLLTAGCAGMPNAVSSLSDVQTSSEQGQIQLVPVTAESVPPPPAASASFPAELTSSQEVDYERLGPGDRLSIRVWESGEATVFAGDAGNIGEVTIDEAGRLYIPYVGTLRAAGMTLAQVRDAAIRKLRTVVLNPQVDIRAVERRSMLVSVQGDVAKTGTFAIDRGRTRLGALLAEVAPSQKNPEMLNVTVRRGGSTGTVRLADIYRNPALDIALRPEDSIIVNEVVENVTVLGSAGVQGQVRIPKRNFSVMDAIGQARGLSEDTADPRAVFLLRANAQGGPPLVYHFDMRKPETVAFASRFVVRDNDAVLISSAPFTQTRRMLSAFAQSLSPVRSVVPVP